MTPTVSTVDGAVRLLLEGIEGLSPSTTRDMLNEARSFQDAGRLSGGEEALLDIAGDLWNGSGRRSFVSNLRYLDSGNRQRVESALTTYFGALAS